MYGSHFDVYDLHASYEWAVVKIYRKAAISLFTCETQERPSMMQGYTLLGCSFSLAQRKEPKETSTLTKPSPIWEGLTAPPVALTLRYAQTIKGLA